MVPAGHMDAAALNARPEGATASPYEAAAASRKRAADESRDGELGGRPRADALWWWFIWVSRPNTTVWWRVRTYQKDVEGTPIVSP